MRTAGDRCPGALRLHSADDGSLARIRIPAGMLTGRQARVLGRVAEELGDGGIDITSRGNLQVRGLAPEAGADLAARLRGAGLLPSDRHDRVRNVVASPLCGLDGRGCANVQAWAGELDAALCAEDAAPGSGLADLSGRFLFALDDGRGDVAALGADVTLIAQPRGRALLGLGAPVPVRSADTSGVVSVRAEDAPRAAALAAAEFLAAARASGTRAWRVRELPPEHAVTAGRLAFALVRAGLQAVRAEPAPALGSDRGLVDAEGGPPPGIVHGPEGRGSLCVLVPLGRATAAQWRLLTELASRDGADELRVTPWRGVVVPGLTPDGAREAARALSEAGLVTDPASRWRGVGACTGRPGCAKSLADVRADAARTVAGGARRFGPLPVYFSGCERRCGHPGGRWVDVLATGDGYDVAVRDTTAAAEPRHGTEAPVPAEQLADALAAVRGTR